MSAPRGVKIAYEPPDVTVGQLKAWSRKHKISFVELSDVMGVKSLQNILYRLEDSEVIPLKTRARLASMVVFSGLPGLFDVTPIDRSVVIRLAQGIRAMRVPAKERTLLEQNLIGYSLRLSEVILGDLELQEVKDEHSKNDGSVQGGAQVSPRPG